MRKKHMPTVIFVFDFLKSFIGLDIIDMRNLILLCISVLF